METLIELKEQNTNISDIVDEAVKSIEEIYGNNDLKTLSEEDSNEIIKIIEETKDNIKKQCL